MPANWQRLQTPQLQTKATTIPDPMKLKHNALSRIALLALTAGSLSTTALIAGTASKTPAAVTPAPEEPFVTGNLTVMYETHFISYGQDVWGGGNGWGDALIHPSVELDFNLGGGWQAYPDFRN